MKWSVIGILVVACQVENPDSSTVQSGGDSLVEAVNITAENSYATIKITTDQPLKAGEEGTLRINFTAKKNLKSETRIVEQQGSGGQDAEGEQPLTYEQRPVMRLAYTYTSQPQIEADESNNQIPHIDSSSTRRVSLKNMEAGSSFTLIYKVTAESTFFIEAKLDVAGETEKFTSGSDDYYRHSKLQINVDSQKTINPDDYATVEITRDVYEAKPAVKIKVTPQVRNNASEIETIVTSFTNREIAGREQAECSGQGVNACGDGTTVTSAFAAGNGITINHKISPYSDKNTSVTVEVKFILKDGTEIVAGSDTLSWTVAEVTTIVASAPAAASLQGGSSGVLWYSQENFIGIASLQFLVIKPAARNDGLGLLRVVFKTYTLKSGAKLHLKIPFEHAYAGRSNDDLVEYVKYDNETATLYSDNKTGGRNWRSYRGNMYKKYEIEFKQITGHRTVMFDFLVPANVGSQQVRASMKIKDEGADDEFHRFGNSYSHSVDFTGKCEWNKQASLRNDYMLIGTNNHGGSLVAQIFNNTIMKVGHRSIIRINNSANIYLGDRAQNRDILVDVWGTARSDHVTYNVGNTITTVSDSREKEINNRHYDRYRLKPHNIITAHDGLNLRIPVRPIRDGREFIVRVTNVKEGRDTGNLMATFNFKVAPIPRRSCM